MGQSTQKQKREVNMSKKKKLDVTMTKEQKPPFGVILSECFGEAFYFVEQCITHLTQFGLETQGLFRIPGITNNVLNLKNKVEADPWHFVFDKDEEIYTITSLFIQFIRNIPGSLMQSSLYGMWLEVAIQKDVQKTKEALQLLDSEKRYLLGKICCFLYKVHQNHSTNKMVSLNLAIVFSPSLIILVFDGNSNFLEYAKHSEYLVAQLIDHSNELFADNEIDNPFLKDIAWPSTHPALVLPLQKVIEEVLCLLQVPGELKIVIVKCIIRIHYLKPIKC